MSTYEDSSKGFFMLFLTSDLMRGYLFISVFGYKQDMSWKDSSPNAEVRM